MDRAHRLTRDADFQRMRQHGRSWAHPLLVLRVVAGTGTPRFGLIVSKKIGKAHDRNRVRRRLREICRRYLPCLKSEVDLVLIARPPIVAAAFGDINATVGQLLGRARLLDPSRACES